MIVLKSILCALALLGLVFAAVIFLTSKFRLAPVHGLALLAALILASFSLTFFWKGIELKARADAGASLVSDIGEAIGNAGLGIDTAGAAGLLTGIYAEKQYRLASEMQGWGIAGAVVSALAFLFFLLAVRPKRPSYSSGGDDFDAYQGFGNDELDSL